MRNSARVGEQTGQTKKRSNIAPSRASESIFGVERLVLPLMLRSPQPWSSARMMTMLGFGAAATGDPAWTAVTGQSSREPQISKMTCFARVIILIGAGNQTLKLLGVKMKWRKWPGECI